jgi:hypothetical protein
VSGGVPPYTYTLTGSDGSTQTFGPTSATSHDFTVTVTQNTTYTLTVTDSQGCSRTATTSLTANPISVSLSVAGNTACDGNLTITATVTGASACEGFAWTIDGTAVPNNSTNTLAYRQLDGTCHTIAVTASCGGCSGSASTKISQCVATTLDCS